MKKSGGRPSKFAPDQIDRILAAWIAGDSIQSIQARWPCDPSYPDILAKRRGIHRSKRDENIRKRRRLLG